MTTTKTTTAPTTRRIAGALLSVARVMNRVRVHDTLCRRAGVDLDRGGAAMLYKLHVEGDDVRLTDLAERLAVDPPAVTRKVQQLERAGLLSRGTDPDDARASRVKLTRQGRSAIERLLHARVAWLEGLLQGWPPEDLQRFAELLERFASTVSEGTEDRHGR